MIYSLHTRWLWGDYGDTLINGHCKLEPRSGAYLLDRVGPFVPSLMMPFCMDGSPVLAPRSVAERLKEIVPEMGIRSTVLRKAVRLPWHKWDLSAEWMKVRPEGGEPENYILTPPHCPKTAGEMEEIVELLLPEADIPDLEREHIQKKGEHGRMIYLPQLITKRKFNITGIRYAGYKTLLCDEPFAEKLRPLFDPWVRFVPVLRKRLGMLRPM